VSIPNFLSLVRIILVPVMVILLIDGAFREALIVLTSAGLTDALDGFLARVLHQRTSLGAYLDPIADKTLITSCFVTLSILGIIPSWLAVIVVSRDFIIILGAVIFFMSSIPFEIKPALVSKITTVFQIITVFAALIIKIFPHEFHKLWVLPLEWGTAFFTILSGFYYITKGVKIINIYNKE